MSAARRTRGLGIGRAIRAARREIVERVFPRERVLGVAAERSLCTRERLIGLRRLADAAAARHDRGDVAECGVYRGGSAVVLADSLLRDRPGAIWLFDAFTGMPEPGPEDPPEARAETGLYRSSPEDVRDTFAAARVPFDRVRLVTGRLEQTLPAFTPPDLVFLHLDCDWYASVKASLERLHDAVVPGGVIVVDDYGHWAGCRRAVEEFFAARGLAPELRAIDDTSHYWWKA